MTQTVFVTGASGFIARHIVLQLLQAGHSVRGSVRSAAKADDVRASMQAQLGDDFDAPKLEFVELDLTQDAGWSEAMTGADALLHTASPFPIAQPKNEDDLIRPAVDGTLRALTAAQSAGINRVVLTSSVAAVMYRDPMSARQDLNEDDWSDPTSAACAPYARSKTLAERAAWDFVAENPAIRLTTVNPGFVLGPPLDADFASSMDFIKRVMRGKDPAVPQLAFDIVDVRDIARMHVAALSTPASEGQRLIGSAGPMWFSEIAEVLRAAYPDRKIARRVAPNWFIRLLGLFDPQIRSITPSLGKLAVCSSDRARDMLGIDFTAPKTSVLDAAEYLVENGHIR